MKKFILFLVCLFIPAVIFAQTVSEKKVFSPEKSVEPDVYSYKLDEKSGTYIYMQMDTTHNPNFTVLSNKGNSNWYEYIDNYNTFFDAIGNYYIVAYNKVTDSTYIYFFIKNGKEEFSCDFINSDLVEKNGNLFFLCTDKSKSYIVNYDITSGNYSKGKAYDEIDLCKYEKVMSEGEPQGKLGFTNDGKPYYIAKSNKQAFVVVGETELKHYADIEPYNFKTDNKGTFLYTAKDTGSFDFPGGGFVVYGDRQFKQFYYVYDIEPDNKGNVYYIGTESSEDYSPQMIMCNDKPVSKIYSGGVYNVDFTPDGKMFFIASEKKKKSDEYESFVVFDGKEGKRYQSVFNIKILPNNTLLYSAQKNDDYALAVIDGEEIGVKGKSIISSEVLSNGQPAIISANFGDYEKKIKDKYYLSIGEKDFGPYDGMQMIDYVSQNYFLSDKSGNYVYYVNNIRNNSDYYSVLYWNGGKSKEYDIISDIYLYKGKAIYTVSNLIDKDKFIYRYKVLYGDKVVTSEYTSYANFTFDEKKGLASFYAVKNNEIYKIEIKF